MHLPFLLLDLATLDESQIEAMRVSAVTGLTLRFLQFLRTCTPEAAAVHMLRWQPLIGRPRRRVTRGPGKPACAQ